MTTDRDLDPETGVEQSIAEEDALLQAPATGRDERSSDTLSGYLHVWWQGVKYGELGSLPIIAGLVVIVIVFGSLDSTFLTEQNFTNLMLQTAYIAAIAIGVVFVLLIGEIDLSVAFVSGVGGVVMTLLLRPDDPGWPWWLAIGVAVSKRIRTESDYLVAGRSLGPVLAAFSVFATWFGAETTATASRRRPRTTGSVSARAFRPNLAM